MINVIRRMLGVSVTPDMNGDSGVKRSSLWKVEREMVRMRLKDIGLLEDLSSYSEIMDRCEGLVARLEARKLLFQKDRLEVQIFRVRRAMEYFKKSRELFPDFWEA